MTRASDTARLIGAGATINDGTTITVDDNSDNLTLTSTDADANIGPNIRMYRNSSSPADDDLIGGIVFDGRNDNSQDFQPVRIRAFSSDVSDGTEDGGFDIATMTNGSLANRVDILPTETVINNGSIDADFRVESDGNINMLHVDGGSDLVTIGGLTGTAGNEDSGYGPLQVGNTASSGTILQMLANSSNTTTIHFGDAVSGDGRYAGYMQYAHSDNSFQLGVSASAIGFKIYSGGNFEKMGNSDQARIVPQSDDAGYLGESSKRWQAVYAVNGSIQTSDKNMKTEITDSSLGLNFVKALRPVSYKWKSGGKSFSYDKDDLKKENPTITDVAGKRNHYGLIAQEVKEALGDTDFGGWISEDVTDENATQSLRYSQFIAPLIKAVQELSAKVETLEAEVTKLKG